MKKAIAVLMTMTACSATASTSIIWGTSIAASPYLWADAAFTVPINGDLSGAAGDGGLVQLLFVGGDGYDGLFTGTTFGTSSEAAAGNDVLVGWGRMGQGTPAASLENGRFVVTTGHGYPDTSQFAILFFTQPSAGALPYSGAIPNSGAYGVITGFSTTAVAQDAFTINANHYANLPVPEPGMMGLAAVGLATVLARRKFAKK